MQLIIEQAEPRSAQADSANERAEGVLPPDGLVPRRPGVTRRAFRDHLRAEVHRGAPRRL